MQQLYKRDISLFISWQNQLLNCENSCMELAWIFSCLGWLPHINTRSPGYNFTVASFLLSYWHYFYKISQSGHPYFLSLSNHFLLKTFQQQQHPDALWSGVVSLSLGLEQTVASKLWNSFPLNLRSVNTGDIFRKQLKINLFKLDFFLTVSHVSCLITFQIFCIVCFYHFVLIV